MLSNAVHFGNGFVHLVNSLRLLCRGGGNLTYQLAHLVCPLSHFGKDLIGLTVQRRSFLYLLYYGINEYGAIFCLIGGASRQASDFIGHHGKSGAGFTGSGGFHCRIKSKQICLKSDLVNSLNDL